MYIRVSTGKNTAVQGNPCFWIRNIISATAELNAWVVYLFSDKLAVNC